VETVGLTPWLLASSKAFEVHGNRFDVLSFQALPLHFPATAREATRASLACQYLKLHRMGHSG